MDETFTLSHRSEVRAAERALLPGNKTDVWRDDQRNVLFFVFVFCLFVCFKTTPPVHACFQSGVQKADKVFDTPHVWTEKCNAFRGERDRFKTENKLELECVSEFTDVMSVSA